MTTPGGLDPTQVRVAPTGSIYSAPKGTAAPATAVSALAAPWYNLGYASDDGVTLSRSMDTETVNGWQSSAPLRYIVTGTSLTVAFALQQFNLETVPLYFGLPKTVVTEDTPSGNFKFMIPADVPIDERAFVVETVDGTVHTRYVILRGMVTETDDLPLKRSEESQLSVTISAMAAPDGSLCHVLTDDPNLDPAA
jgi:hypothetical protein